MTSLKPRVREDPETLAKYAIGLLERRLYNVHGLKLRLGAELEFTLVPRHDAAVGIDLPAPIMFGADKDTLVDEGFAPNATRGQMQDVRYAIHPIPQLDIDLSSPHPPTRLRGAMHTTATMNVRDPLLPDSHYVAYSYEEAEGQSMLETVISHEGRHDTLPPDGRRALTFARSIEGLRHDLATSDNPDRRLAVDPAHHRLLKTVAKDWRPSFDGFMRLQPPGSGYRTHGLHINLSIIDRHDKPILTTTFKGEDPAILNGLRTMMHDGSYLLLHDATSLERDNKRTVVGYATSFAEVRASSIGRDTYIELSRPAANSNPYYATLLTLLGVYDAVATSEAPRPAPPRISYNPPADRTRGEFKARFGSPDNRVLQVLDRLEPGLGARFADAIETTPPGSEKSPQRAHGR